MTLERQRRVDRFMIITSFQLRAPAQRRSGIRRVCSSWLFISVSGVREWLDKDNNGRDNLLRLPEAEV